MSDVQGSTQTGTVPRVAPKPVIRLDKSKPFSECHGERTPQDPHYGVHYWQGRRVGTKYIALPFDSQGLLIEDDGREQPYQALNVEEKPVTHQPLYNRDMRELLAAMRSRMTSGIKQTAAEDALEDEGFTGQTGPDEDDVNFASWLRGEVRYMPQVLRAAAKKRYSKQYADVREMVIDLVLDEKVVNEDEVCEELKRHLPK